MFSILYVSHEASLTGAPNCLYALIKRINRKKYHPIFFSPCQGPLIKKLKDIGVETVIFKKNITLNLRRLIRGKSIDLVHVNTIVSTYGAFAGKLARKKVLWHIHEDISKRLWNRFLKQLIRVLSDRIVVVSDGINRSFGNKNKVTTIHNGIDIKEFVKDVKGDTIKQEFDLNENFPIIGVIGSIAPAKGHKYFLKALVEVEKKYPKVATLIVGESPPVFRRWRGRMEELVEKLGLRERVIFTGLREDISQIMAALDVFVLPSIYEAFGLVLLEAMAFKKPIIASNVGGIPEIVEHGVTGLLVPPGDSESLAKAIIEITQHPKEAVKMGERGRERVERYFSLDVYVQKIEKVYEELLS